jgi:sugar/nucleoside kinase (ribokinase family)
VASLGRGVRFVGRAGLADAAEHRRALELAGPVETAIAEDPVLPTGSVVALLSPDGERSMYTDRGANTALEARDFPGDLLEGAAVLHVSGYALFEPGPRAAVTELVARAKDARLLVTVDPSSASELSRTGSDAFLAWTAGADVVFPNLEEGRILTGREEPAEVVESLLECYPAVALKLGADGALAVDRRAERAVEPARTVAVVDSTGSGDAFCAGFLTSLLLQRTLAECTRAAVDTAGVAVSRMGARPRRA